MFIHFDGIFKVISFELFVFRCIKGGVNYLREVVDYPLLYVHCTGWRKSHFTLLEANKTKTNRAKKIGCISNERPDLGVFY